MSSAAGTSALVAGSALAPNLARRPFVNARPVTRLAAVLWLLGAALSVANVLAVSAYLVGSAAKRERLAELEAAVVGELQRADALDAKLEGMDLEDLNDRVAFLNRRIAERTFTWGRLFDDLSEVLPREVRIVGISPLSISGDAKTGARQAGSRRAGSRRSPGTAQGIDDTQPEFVLTFNGVARSSEQLLDFIDALFAWPDFSRPDLVSEESGADGLTFTATATYRPRHSDDSSPAPVARSMHAAEATPAAAPTPKANAAVDSGAPR